MDWPNEVYVRVYTRETDDDLALSWQARALWDAMMKRFDRSGIIATKRGARGLSALVRIPPNVVEDALPELLTDGRVVEVEGGYLAPNFTAAQEAVKSDKLRQKESRERRRSEKLPNVTNRDGDVTFRDGNHLAPLVGVTDRHALSRDVTLCFAEHTVAEQSERSSRARDPGSTEQAPEGGTVPPATPEPTASAPQGATAAPDLGYGWSKLSTELWRAGGERYRELVAAGVDATAKPTAWNGLPDKLLGAVIAYLRDEKQLTVDEARQEFMGALDTAEAVARDKLTLQYLTPSRFLPVESFRKSAESSPAQVARASSNARGGPPPERPRMLNRL